MYEKWLNQYLKPDFEPQPLCHFLTDFNLVYIYGNAFNSCLRIPKSHVSIAIFSCGLGENV